MEAKQYYDMKDRSKRVRGTAWNFDKVFASPPSAWDDSSPSASDKLLGVRLVRGLEAPCKSEE